MPANANAPDDPHIAGRVWSFANCEFDESVRQLRVGGQRVYREAKPLDVLHQLLVHAGEVVTKDDLLEAVWPGVAVVEGSLATAVSKLRKAIGDEGQAVVLTVPRIGYRLGIAVHSRRGAPPDVPELGFKAGDTVPGRDQWRMTRKLDVSFSSEVCLVIGRFSKQILTSFIFRRPSPIRSMQMRRFKRWSRVSSPTSIL